MFNDNQKRAVSAITAENFIAKLKTLQSPEELKKFQRFFKFSEENQPGEDKFLGVRMGQVFALAKENIDMSLAEIEKLLESPFHEARVGAVSIMDFQARSKKTSPERKRELFDLYLRRHDRINNWDLVDRSAIYVVGGYLADKPRDILYKLARSKDTWERRTAIISTAYFIKRGDVDDTFKIAEILLADEEDLVHKAVGWMLRYAGDSDRERLLKFLDDYATSMPRVLLRYATEKLPKTERESYLALKKETK